MCHVERRSPATSATDLEASPNGKGANPSLIHELFREVNDQIRKLGEHWNRPGDRVFVCECADARCIERLAASDADYDRTRSHPARFLLKPEHASATHGRVVERTDAFVVLETAAADPPA